MTLQTSDLSPSCLVFVVLLLDCFCITCISDLLHLNFFDEDRQLIAGAVFVNMMSLQS